MTASEDFQAQAEKRHAGEMLPPVLDREALRAAAERDPGLLRQLVEAFLAEAPALLGELRAGIRDERAEEVERAAQTLKSTAGNFGGKRASQAARTVELEARANHLDQTQSLLPELEAELAQFCRALSHFLSEPAT